MSPALGDRIERRKPRHLGPDGVSHMKELLYFIPGTAFCFNFSQLQSRDFLACRICASWHPEPQAVIGHLGSKNREPWLSGPKKRSGPFHIGSINVGLIPKTANREPRTPRRWGGG